MPHNRGVSSILPTIAETSLFTRKAEKLLTAHEREEMMLYLATY
jgi:hypothetical protein